MGIELSENTSDIEIVGIAAGIFLKGAGDSSSVLTVGNDDIDCTGVRSPELPGDATDVGRSLDRCNRSVILAPGDLDPGNRSSPATPDDSAKERTAGNIDADRTVIDTILYLQILRLQTTDDATDEHVVCVAGYGNGPLVGAR